ncbi:MAG: hypothetical protein KIT19_07465 [Phycisphaeraceae bacterium]|nr:hypothetical protein [Phycisphaeraceae bacterium]
MLGHDPAARWAAPGPLATSARIIRHAARGTLVAIFPLIRERNRPVIPSRGNVPLGLIRFDAEQIGGLVRRTLRPGTAR